MGQHASSSHKTFEIQNGALVSVENRQLRSGVIPGGVSTIKAYAFRGCFLLVDLALPDGLHTIGVNAFGGCSSLAHLTLPSSLTTIGQDAFWGCSSLASAGPPFRGAVCALLACHVHAAAHGRLDAFVRTLRAVLLRRLIVSFLRAPAGTLCLPEGLQQIGEGAFERCTSLRAVRVPDTVTSIGRRAFTGCTGLTAGHLAELEARYEDPGVGNPPR